MGFQMDFDCPSLKGFLCKRDNKFDTEITTEFDTENKQI